RPWSSFRPRWESLALWMDQSVICVIASPSPDGFTGGLPPSRLSVEEAAVAGCSDPPPVKIQFGETSKAELLEHVFLWGGSRARWVGRNITPNEKHGVKLSDWNDCGIKPKGQFLGQDVIEDDEEMADGTHKESPKGRYVSVVVPIEGERIRRGWTVSYLPLHWGEETDHRCLYCEPADFRSMCGRGEAARLQLPPLLVGATL
ncbi:hypothetical protein THAOC_19210, partial [Thalassiosira oceanica]